MLSYLPQVRIIMCRYCDLKLTLLKQVQLNFTAISFKNAKSLSDAADCYLRLSEVEQQHGSYPFMVVNQIRTK